MFSNAYAHTSLINQNFVMNMTIFPAIWIAKIPERMRCLLLRIVRGAIMTNAERARRGITTDPLCPVCSADIEPCIHTFRDCQTAMRLWQQRGSKTMINFFQGKKSLHASVCRERVANAQARTRGRGRGRSEGPEVSSSQSQVDIEMPSSQVASGSQPPP
jgi:predicted nucleic acid-binding Zn ribbon protein